MKDYEMRLVVKEEKRGEQKESKYKTEIKFTDDTDIEEMMKFIDGVRRLWTTAIKHSKKGNCIAVEIIRSTYDNWSDGNKELVQKSFDRWIFEGYNEDFEGIHLMPDTRYTDEYHDLYLSKDVMHDLMSI